MVFVICAVGIAIFLGIFLGAVCGDAERRDKEFYDTGKIDLFCPTCIKMIRQGMVTYDLLVQAKCLYDEEHARWLYALLQRCNGKTAQVDFFVGEILGREYHGGQPDGSFVGFSYNGIFTASQCVTHDREWERCRKWFYGLSSCVKPKVFEVDGRLYDGYRVCGPYENERKDV